MEITKPREHVECKAYYREFTCIACPSGGYAFPCDEQGNLSNPEHVDRIKELNPEEYRDDGIGHYEHRYWEPAQGKCEQCEEVVYLTDPLDNTCECGACYNMSGQRVTPSYQCDDQGEPYDYEY